MDKLKFKLPSNGRCTRTTQEQTWNIDIISMCHVTPGKKERTLEYPSGSGPVSSRIFVRIDVVFSRGLQEDHQRDQRAMVC